MSLAYDVHGAADDRPPLVMLHGLTFDRRQWQPVLRKLVSIDPDRRIIAVDLPGHGESGSYRSYDLGSVVAAVHAAVDEVNFAAPVVVGHSIGGLLATIYAATYPVRAVVNLDQPLLPGPFGDLVRQAEPMLRGPSYLDVWQRLLDGMRLELLPPDARQMVQAISRPRSDLLLGYWNELLTDSNEVIGERRIRELAVLGRRGVGYQHVTTAEPPHAYRRWLESALPGATITVLPGGGHFPHLASPAEVARLLAGDPAGPRGANRPTVMPVSAPTPRHSTRHANGTHTSPSATAFTTASAPHWPAWRHESPSPGWCRACLNCGWPRGSSPLAGQRAEARTRDTPRETELRAPDSVAGRNGPL